MTANRSPNGAATPVLSQYKQLASLQAVLIVSHSNRRITVISRAAEWETREYRPGESVPVPGIGVTLSVDDFDGSVMLNEH